MPNKVLVPGQDGTPKQIVFANHAGDFGPATAVDLRLTTDGSNELDVEIAMASLADGAGRQSAKFDFGANRAERYAVRAAIEFAATPTAGDLVELLIGYSHTATAANGNPANLTGSDGAYAGYSSNLEDSILQLDPAGYLVATVQATGTVQKAFCGVFEPKGRYGILVVKNEAGAAFHSDDIESHIVFDPIVAEIQ